MARELGHRDAGRTLAWLARLGLVVPAAPDHQWYRLVPLLAAVVRAQYPARPRVLRAAADWHVRHGRSAEALRLHLAAEDPDSCAALLSGSGSALLAGGAAVDVAAAIRSLPAGHRDERLTLLLGEALAITGDTAAAVDTYATLDDGCEELPAGLAWRYGAALYYAGTSGDALAVLRRGRLTGADSADEAQLLAWTAAAHWLAGDAAASRAAAHRAHGTAEATGDPGPVRRRTWRWLWWPTSTVTRPPCTPTTSGPSLWPRPPVTWCRRSGSGRTWPSRWNARPGTPMRSRC
ncbi:hypothetical protein ACFQY4_34915 [Catellatospora bangladeshensis]|uniref:hypothetical protein n=1 Tax=Catellatospora bangladeshensis TaxID=310355 RepID=UPI0036215894